MCVPTHAKLPRSCGTSGGNISVLSFEVTDYSTDDAPLATGEHRAATSAVNITARAFNPATGAFHTGTALALIRKPTF